MAVPKTQARIWSRAVQGINLGNSQETGWSGALEALAVMAGDPRISAHIQSLDDDAAENFLRAMAGEFLWEAPLALGLELKNRRLFHLAQYLPELWNERIEEKTGLKEVVITLPYVLNDAELQALCSYLEMKFRCRLQPRTEIDPSLLGGYTAQVGDKLWDATVHGSLDRLKEQLIWDREIEDAAERQ